MVRIKIGKGELKYTRPKLKLWLLLQDQQAKIVKAIKEHNEVAKNIIYFVSIALSISEEEIKDLPWYQVGGAYSSIVVENLPRKKFPFLNTKIKDKKEIWDYEGRTWYIWSHMLAKEYGWSLEYISELDVDDALALAQEISVDEQLEKEWDWMTSWVAYQSKDGFKELPRPDWMKYSTEAPKIPKVRIRKEFMPVGVDGTPPEFRTSFETV